MRGLNMARQLGVAGTLLLLSFALEVAAFFVQGPLSAPTSSSSSSSRRRRTWASSLGSAGSGRGVSVGGMSIIRINSASRLLSTMRDYDDGDERGRLVTYYFNEGLHEYIDNIPLEDTVYMMLTPSGGCLYTCVDGQCYWGEGAAGLPPEVENALSVNRGEQGRPTAISLGTGGRYFLQFENGERQWRGSEYLDDVIERSQYEDREIRMVAFGESFGSFVVLYGDGTSTWRDVPTQLENYISRSSPPVPDYVSMGPAGEYFIRFEDGSSRFGGMDDTYVRGLRGVDQPREVTFAEGNQYLVRYNIVDVVDGRYDDDKDDTDDEEAETDSGRDDKANVDDAIDV